VDRFGSSNGGPDAGRLLIAQDAAPAEIASPVPDDLASGCTVFVHRFAAVRSWRGRRTSGVVRRHHGVR
jgi:hypothetical protein